MKCLRISLIFLFMLIPSLEVAAQIYAEKDLLAEVKALGLKVDVEDNVTDGCWTQPHSAENKAISLLGQYGLYNTSSHFFFYINSAGYRHGNICVVSLRMMIYSINLPDGLRLHGSSGSLFSGPEQSDAIRSEVESFVEELVAAMTKAGI